MKKRIVSERQTELNDILRSIKDYSEKNERKLVTWLVTEKGFYLSEIAAPLKVTPQALRNRYPELIDKEVVHE